MPTSLAMDTPTLNAPIVLALPSRCVTEANKESVSNCTFAAGAAFAFAIFSLHYLFVCNNSRKKTGGD